MRYSNAYALPYPNQDTEVCMSILGDWSAGRKAGKAALLFQKLFGRLPSKADTQFLQDQAYLRANEYELLFDLLCSELAAMRGFRSYDFREIRGPDGSASLTQVLGDLNATEKAMANKLIQILETILRSGNVPIYFRGRLKEASQAALGAD